MPRVVLALPVMALASLLPAGAVAPCASLFLRKDEKVLQPSFDNVKIGTLGTSRVQAALAQIRAHLTELFSLPEAFTWTTQAAAG
jgi:hypothetical protein